MPEGIMALPSFKRLALMREYPGSPKFQTASSGQIGSPNYLQFDYTDYESVETLFDWMRQTALQAQVIVGELSWEAQENAFCTSLRIPTDLAVEEKRVLESFIADTPMVWRVKNQLIISDKARSLAQKLKNAKKREEASMSQFLDWVLTWPQGSSIPDMLTVMRLSDFDVSPEDLPGFRELPKEVQEDCTQFWDSLEIDLAVLLSDLVEFRTDQEYFRAFHYKDYSTPLCLTAKDITFEFSESGEVTPRPQMPMSIETIQKKFWEALKYPAPDAVDSKIPLGLPGEIKHIIESFQEAHKDYPPAVSRNSVALQTLRSLQTSVAPQAPLEASIPDPLEASIPEKKSSVGVAPLLGLAALLLSVPQSSPDKKAVSSLKVKGQTTSEKRRR